MLSGRAIFTRKILINLPSASVQVQPCGVDLTLKSVSRFTGPGTLDFSNSRRQTAPTEKLSSSPDKHHGEVEGRWDLSDGTFLVEFNELVDVPLDCVGFLHARSSLWRSGATIDAGVCDAGYKGALGALLEVSAGPISCLRPYLVGRITWLAVSLGQRNASIAHHGLGQKFTWIETVRKRENRADCLPAHERKR